MVLQSFPLLVVTVAIEYSFAYKTLGIRISKILTFTIMLIVHLLTGWLNLQFHIAGDIANTIYYTLITLGLYLFLFKGKAVKKLFFAILIGCGLPVIYYIFFPFVRYFFGQTATKYLLVLQIFEYANTLLAVVLMEYVGKKFQNLRRELPAGYTVYLSSVVLFVYVAVYFGYDSMLMRNEGIISLSATFSAAAFAAVGMVVVIVAIFAVDRQVDVSLKEQLYTLHAENFKNREFEWRRLSSFRHDIKNHLLCLSNLLENKKTEQASSYMFHLTDTVRQFDSLVQTGNDYADALLNVKYAEAMEANIKVSLEMAIPAQGFIEPVDLCCILCNAFDNAIAACKVLTESERWIAARAFIKQEQFVIVIKNSKPSYVTVANGEVSPKEVTADHGIGLDTVKTVVAKYNGTLNLSADTVFSFSVLLPPRHW